MGSFSFNTESCCLPGGLWIDDERCLTTAELRALSGREEEWLAHHGARPSAARVTWVLQACLLSLDGTPPTPDLIRKLLAGDRDYLMLQLRRLTLGDDVHAVVVCRQCGGKIDVDFHTSAIPFEFRPQTAASYRLELGGRTLRFRLPTGADQEAVAALDCDAGVMRMLDLCVLDDGGRNLLREDREAVIREMERLAPLVELDLDVACPDCRHVFVLPFDITAYFFEEVAATRKDLLRQVHALALCYHWTETEILALQRDRRYAYLGLLNESMREDG